MDELSSVMSTKAAYQVNDIFFISCIGNRRFLDEKYYLEDSNEWMKQEDLPDTLGPGPIFFLKVKKTSQVRVSYPTPFVALHRFDPQNAKYVYIRDSNGLSVSPIIPVIENDYSFPETNFYSNKIRFGPFSLRQPFLETTTFDAGMGDWEFKMWMPEKRRAFAEIRKSPLPNRKNALYIHADGKDDDGIFFLETRHCLITYLRTNSPIRIAD